VSTGGRGRAEELLDEADAAMYHAKALGGSRAEVFDAALGRQVKARSSAERRLRSALDEHRIVVHYQPIVELATQADRRVRGARPDPRAQREAAPAVVVHRGRRGERVDRAARRAGARPRLSRGRRVAASGERTRRS
jgi:predicted signal transduction protein with EAL and GGDEF domain